jgi:ribose-phosphate pyrophosphokinase
MESDTKKPILISCQENRELLNKILKLLGEEVNHMEFARFKDGEIGIKLYKDVQRREVIVFSTLGPPVNENIMELLLCVSTLKRNGAYKVHVLCTYMAYARQDRPVREYKSHSGKFSIFGKSN